MVEIVSVDFVPGLIELGEKLHDAPVGRPLVQLSVTDPLNPLTGLIEIE